MGYEVTPDFKGRSASLSAEDGTLYPEDTGTLKYTVVFDPPPNGPSNPDMMCDIARDADGIPNLWDTHPSNQWKYVQNIDAVQVGPNTVEVVVRYVTIENPIDRPPEIEFLSAVSTEPVDRDKDDNPITNSAGELFDPPITKDCRDLVIRARRYQSSFDKPQASAFEGSVNSQTIWGYAPGKVKCNVYTGREVRFAGLWMYEVTFEFQVREDGWKRRILDQGFREKTGVDETTDEPLYAAIKDTSGVPLSSPTMLDGAGVILADTAPPVFLEFDLITENDFTILGLD